MELAIADYKLAFCNPATKKSMQEVASFWKVPIASLGHHISGAREFKIGYIADNSNLSIKESIQLIKWLGRLAEAGFPAGQDEVYNLASKYVLTSMVQTLFLERIGLDNGQSGSQHSSKIELPPALTVSVVRHSTLLQ